MDLTSLFGIIVGIAAIVGAMVFKSINFSVFFNPAALLVIFAGTLSCILNAFPGKDLKTLGKLFGILFSSDDKGKSKKIEIIETMDKFAVMARKEGLLALESAIGTINDDFMKKGVRWVIDGASPEFIIEILSSEMQEIEERHSVNASIFSQAGTYAPTLGVLGAVFGLIAAMSHINEIQSMAEAVAAAFIATILGIFTGYVLWNPFANKLKVKSKHEMVEKRMIMEGLISLQRGESPTMIRDKLTAFLSDKERAAIASPAES
jgi:chemotaxis protein MotA